MKKILSALLLVALLLSALAGCVNPNPPVVDESTSSTTDEATEDSGKENNTTDTKGEDTTEKYIPTIEELNDNAYGEAYYLMESYAYMWDANPPLPNGWTYDNRFDITNTNGGESCKISDASDVQFYAFTRDFDPESDGILRFEAKLGFSSTKGGAYIAFISPEGKRFVTVGEQDGYFVLIGTSTVKTDIAVPTTGFVEHSFNISIDLDKNTASLI